MSNWIPIAAATDIPPGEAREFVAAGRMIALFHVDGEFHALDGICPHQGGPLGKGAVSGCTITCPWHGWQYDVRTGQHKTIASLVHERFEVKVEDGQVWVLIDS